MAQENEESYCKCLHGKPLFSALYGTYTVTLQELKAVLKARTLADQTNLPKTTGQQTTYEDGFQEVRRRKRRATDEITGTSKKATVQTIMSPALNIPPRRSSPDIFRPPPSGQKTRTPSLPKLRPLQMRRQFLAKQADSLQ
jgi:hypothetical protein